MDDGQEEEVEPILSQFHFIHYESHKGFAGITPVLRGGCPEIDQLRHVMAWLSSCVYLSSCAYWWVKQPGTSY